MNIHEYQAKAILKEFGINVAGGKLAYSIDEALQAAKKLNGDKFVIKAQVHAGGRGLGGGVKIAKSLSEVESIAKDMLGMSLITPQTSKDGKVVRKIYIEEALDISKEIYLSLAFDRKEENISIIASKEGGMSIEETAKDHPELIKKVNVDPQIGLRDFHILNLIGFFGFSKELSLKFSEILKKLYQIYISKDANLIEINPLVLTSKDEFYALDAKMSFDDSAVFRHSEILALKDDDEEEPSELEAKKSRLNYVKLEGNVGCIVNGAGLAMATMDIIQNAGGKSANFLDVGGSANPASVAKAFEIILRDKNVKSIFVNIFGGIVRCDRIAGGILEAAKEFELKTPIVIRLQGTNSTEAMDMLKSAELKNLHVVENLLDGARLAVKFANEKDLI
ncbi:ADP-forming succinate--CoA ligase subunit beta [Campylobacter sp. CCUG 57310]|uniref:ADP-forming succinate--CoA ligase subunit beta n=1 Tax=Campylobacter sp. CCUG 57310 TaxID=2517362 RepID=UPI00156352D4|nr:ADP-forming succinate--CoA ligase subunit beta [Campylobacter sp. CCUG 57310]QKF92187.1 succinyl-CoA synthetase, beta subunit [Campylobacter sp. CCUG 57310]